jgi:hypothetical protein
VWPSIALSVGRSTPAATARVDALVLHIADKHAKRVEEPVTVAVMGTHLLARTVFYISAVFIVEIINRGEALLGPEPSHEDRGDRPRTRLCLCL